MFSVSLSLPSSPPSLVFLSSSLFSFLFRARARDACTWACVCEVVWGSCRCLLSLATGALCTTSPLSPQCRRFLQHRVADRRGKISQIVFVLFLSVHLFPVSCFSFCRCFQQKQNLLQVLVGASPTLFTQTKRGVRAKAFSLAKTKQKDNSSKEPFGLPETHVALKKKEN